MPAGSADLRRQVAISRLLAAGMVGGLLGTPMAGILGDLIGWRFVLAVIGILCLASFITASIGFRSALARAGAGFDLTAVLNGYRAIFKNPQAKYCFGAVMLEGIFMMGIFPYVALLLREGGEPRAMIAGIVLAGFALGGVIYSLSVSRLLPRIGERGLILAGAGFMGFALLAAALRAPWQVQMAQYLLMGCGFYMIHGVIQIYATELAPSARGSAAIHSGSFCLGLAIGPVYFGFGVGGDGADRDRGDLRRGHFRHRIYLRPQTAPATDAMMACHSGASAYRLLSMRGRVVLVLDLW